MWDMITAAWNPGGGASPRRGVWRQRETVGETESASDRLATESARHRKKKEKKSPRPYRFLGHWQPLMPAREDHPLEDTNLHETRIMVCAYQGSGRRRGTSDVARMTIPVAAYDPEHAVAQGPARRRPNRARRRPPRNRNPRQRRWGAPPTPPPKEWSGPPQPRRRNQSIRGYPPRTKLSLFRGVNGERHGRSCQYPRTQGSRPDRQGWDRKARLAAEETRREDRRRQESGEPTSWCPESGPTRPPIDRMTSVRDQYGIQLDFIRPGKPNENPLIEAFNGRLRNDCLNVGLFSRLNDGACGISECGRQDYNHFRSHSALADRTPAAGGGSAGHPGPGGAGDQPPGQESRMLVKTLT